MIVFELYHLYRVFEIGGSDLCQWGRNSYMCNGGISPVHTSVVVLETSGGLFYRSWSLVSRWKMSFSSCFGGHKYSLRPQRRCFRQSLHWWYQKCLWAVHGTIVFSREFELFFMFNTIYIADSYPDQPEYTLVKRLHQNHFSDRSENMCKALIKQNVII